MICGYLIFFTTASAFESEMLLTTTKIHFKLVPTPREFSSDCGIAIYFEVESVATLQEKLDASKIEYEIKLL